MLLFDPTPTGIRWALINEKLIEGTISNKKAIESNLEPLIKSCNDFGYVLPNGGNEFIHEISPITGKDINQLKKCSKLLPEANRSIIELIERLINAHPLSNHYLLCETGFFSRLPEVAMRYPLPEEFNSKSVFRFGGDGLCHRGLTTYLEKQQLNFSRLTSIHLSDFSNVVSILAGNPIESTMGFSPYEGIPSMNGIGDLDPSVVLDLVNTGLPLAEIREILTTRSGLSTLLGSECKFNDLFELNFPAAAFARTILKRNILKAIGSSLAFLGGVDSIVFIGDDLPTNLNFITETCNSIEFLPIVMRNEPLISHEIWTLSEPSSQIKILCWQYNRWQELRNLLGL
jgi:acetate kinase